MEAKLGDKFNLKAYHDKVLSYGAPPVRYVRELMLDEPIIESGGKLAARHGFSPGDNAGPLSGGTTRWESCSG